MEDEKKIYIGNLEFGLTEEDIRKTIEEKGINVKEIKIITDRFTGKPKGFGFAEFDTSDEAQKAIDALNGQELNGRALKVSKAKKMRPKRDDFGSQGGYGGGGGGGGRFRR
ncbi:MAG: RNA-binding protein [Candidatus Omnitrophica bacterium]|nr:RNA-binding protein [Candidatus Omnitrophota bacterium]